MITNHHLLLCQHMIEKKMYSKSKCNFSKKVAYYNTFLGYLDQKTMSSQKMGLMEPLVLKK